MREYKRGTLKSGSGKKVTSRRQAVAIAMSQEKTMRKSAPKNKMRASSRSVAAAKKTGTPAKRTGGMGRGGTPAKNTGGMGAAASRKANMERRNSKPVPLGGVKKRTKPGEPPNRAKSNWGGWSAPKTVNPKKQVPAGQRQRQQSMGKRAR